MKSKFIFLSIVLLFLFSNNIYADEKDLAGADVDYGQHLSGECVTCHNSSGLDRGIPKITGMKIKEFIIKIRGYKTKERDNEVMQMVADRLGDEEINSLALFLSKVK